MTEQELIHQAQRGDQQAFEQLLSENQARIYTLCLRMVGHPEDAMDVAQETFLHAWKGLSTFRGGASFSTWLYRLATNACIDFLRRAKRRREVEAYSLDDSQGEWTPPTDWRQDPQRETEQRELRHLVERGLGQLPPHQRQILVMRELSGLSYQEIAQVMDLDLGTVKSRLARARLALRKKLEGEGNLSLSRTSKGTDQVRPRGGEPDGSL